MKDSNKILMLVGWFLAILLLVLKCTNSSNEIAPIKQNVKVIEKQRKVYIDSFKNARILLAKTNEKLSNDILYYKKEIERLKSKKIEVPKDVQGLVLFFNDRYQTKLNEVVNNKVGLSEETAYDVSFELSEFDNQVEILKNKDKIIFAQDSINTNLTVEIKGFEKSMLLYETEIKAKDNLNLMFEKENKKLKRKNTFTKILVPASFLIGGFLGYTIAK